MYQHLVEGSKTTGSEKYRSIMLSYSGGAKCEQRKLNRLELWKLLYKMKIYVISEFIYMQKLGLAHVCGVVHEISGGIDQVLFVNNMYFL